MIENRIRRTQAEAYDNVLRYWVPSRTTPGKKYLVQLDSYGANGECECPDFRMNFEKLLKQGVTPEQAVARKLVCLKNKRGETRPKWDALRCFHIIEARAELADLTALVISRNETKHPSAPPYVY